VRKWICRHRDALAREICGWLGIALLSAVSVTARTGDGAQGPQTSLTGATADLAPGDPPGEWRRPARDFANTRYSPLAEITRDNVASMRVAWTFADGTRGGHESAPLVIGTTMYVVSPFPNMLYALDLTQPGPAIKWTYKPDPAPIAIGKACCDVVNRGAAYAQGKIIYNLLDGHTVAVDAQSGKELWRRKMADVARGETMTMAPFAIGDRVLVGNSGGEMGAAGWLASLSVEDGNEVWRAFSVGPDVQVRIDRAFTPFYSWMRGENLGVGTWPKDAWKTGGGTAWGWVSYDQHAHLIYYGTSNPGPRVAAQRPGLNLWTAAVFARNPDSGMAKWAYQYTPHDEWDFDGVNEHVLISIPQGDRRLDALVHLDRNGFGYTIDRLTGRVLVAQPFAPENWAERVDLESGKPVVRGDKHAQVGAEVKNICPTHVGFKDWQPSAFSPRTGLLYAAIFNVCMDLTNHKVSYMAGTPYDGMEMKFHPAGGENWGGFIAWDPVHGRKVWEIKEPMMTMSGVLTTASDLVFYGTADGWFRAVDGWSGKVLWSKKLGSGVIGQPISYQGPDGHQYVAVFTGVGGVVSQMMHSKPGFPARGGTLYVFALDGNVDTAQARAGQ
jgi:alcohol dehydrogenase (cytochrome c)